MSCTSLSCSSSVSLTATLVRATERRSARVELPGVARPVHWHLAPGARWTTPTTSVTDGTARPASRADACPVVVVRHPAILPTTDRQVC